MAIAVSAPPGIMFVGDDKPAYAPQLLDSVALTAINLTGVSSITYKLVDKTSQTVVTGGGTVTVTTPSTGLISLAWVVADTATAGEYWLEFVVHWTVSDPEHVLFTPLEIKYAS